MTALSSFLQLLCFLGAVMLLSSAYILLINSLFLTERKRFHWKIILFMHAQSSPKERRRTLGSIRRLVARPSFLSLSFYTSGTKGLTDVP